MTDHIETFAVIPTYNRPEVCRKAIEAITEQVSLVYVIDVGGEQRMPHDVQHAWPKWYVYEYDGNEHPNNLSRTWNQGIKLFEDEVAGGVDEWNVVILNDDAIVPEGWVDAVSTAMRTHGAAAGCSGGHDVVLRQPGPVPLSMRMQGWAFMLKGEAHLRVDEQFEWWYGDSDLDWQARQAGGMAMVRGFPVPNLYADQSTHGIRQVQSAQDAQKFVDKWGMPAW